MTRRAPARSFVHVISMRSGVHALLSLGLLAGSAAVAEPADLAREIATWQEFTRQVPTDNDDGKSIRESSRLLLDDAHSAMASNRPWLALSRLSVVWGNLSATRWVESVDPAARKSLDELEKEWRRAGLPPTADSDVTRAAFASSFASAAGRALAESALLQAGEYHEASLEYGRNTEPGAGFFYLGAMRGQREFARVAARGPLDQHALGARQPLDLWLQQRQLIDVLQRTAAAQQRRGGAEPQRKDRKPAEAEGEGERRRADEDVVPAGFQAGARKTVAHRHHVAVEMHRSLGFARGS